jgi:hypothetical protein
MWVSNCQPVLYPDEVVRGDRGPVPTEIIYFLSTPFLSFEPFNTGATSHSPDGEGAFAFDFDASLCLLHVSTQVWDTGAFDLRGELIYHCCHGGIGYTILGEWESQETTGDLTGCVDEYAPAHRTLDVFMPPPARPMKPREEVFDHAQCAEGVAAIWVGHSHGMCYDLQA